MHLQFLHQFNWEKASHKGKAGLEMTKEQIYTTGGVNIASPFYL